MKYIFENENALELYYVITKGRKEEVYYGNWGYFQN